VSGRFITLEGIDGAGKSTHLVALAQRLGEAGATVVCTREPGGTPLAERLREIVLHEAMDALTAALVVFAARHDHLRTVILPALAAGHTVLCDRFTDATFAYQGAAGGASVPALEQLEAMVQGAVQPDLTFWFDLGPDEAARRRAEVRTADRFEREDLPYFERVRRGYGARMAATPQRFARIDATLAREAVWGQIDAVLRARGW
jgi:dTMP kinase